MNAISNINRCKEKGKNIMEKEKLCRVKEKKARKK